MVNFVHPLPQQKVGGFFAANAAGAKHRHPLATKGLAVIFPPFGKLAKGSDVGINRAFKGADAHLVIVAGVDQDHIGLIDQIVPIAGRNIGPHARDWVNIGLAHGDDLALKLDLHAAKGRRFGKGFLML